MKITEALDLFAKIRAVQRFSRHRDLRMAHDEISRILPSGAGPPQSYDMGGVGDPGTELGGGSELPPEVVTVLQQI